MNVQHRISNGQHSITGLKLSNHFIEKWKEERSEPVPSMRQMELWLMEAFYIQKYRDVRSIKGNAMAILGLYWLPEINLVLKIDEKSGVVVTFVTPKR